MSSNLLKWVALITMIIDHTGAVLFPQYRVMRVIGRISFPIYCFLLVQGRAHTRNVWKYAIRLIVFAVISEPFYDLAFYKTVWYGEHQNVFWTLAIGLLMLIAMQKGGAGVKTVSLILAASFATEYKTDYDMGGVFLIFLFELARQAEVRIEYMQQQNTLLIYKKEKLYNTASQIFMHVLWWGDTQMYGILSAPFIWLYNGKPGKRGGKYFYYLIYPTHLLLLYWLRKTI